MAEIKSKKVDFVNVVDAEGKPIPGFGSPVPSSWLGTDLLPHGTKEADDESTPDGGNATDQDSIDAAVKAATEELEAKNADLETKVADLTKQLEAKTAEAAATAKALAEAKKAAAKPAS